MICAEVRLDEFLDGELAVADRRAAEEHLAGCATCRDELETLRRLEKVLRSVPAAAGPEPEPFLRGVRERSRSARAGRGVAAAAAAAVLAAAVLGYALRPRSSLDLHDALAAYAAGDTERAERRIRDAGPAGLALLRDAMENETGAAQFAAATLLFKLADSGTRERVLAWHQSRTASDDPWVLAEPGWEEGDVDLVPTAVSALSAGRSEQWAVDMFRRLRWLGKEARKRVVGSVVTLLKHENPRVQELALDIVREIDIDFPLSALVDLMDSPGLGAEALKILREATGEDHGSDQDAWRKAIQRRESE